MNSIPSGHTPTCTWFEYIYSTIVGSQCFDQLERIKHLFKNIVENSGLHPFQKWTNNVFMRKNYLLFAKSVCIYSILLRIMSN